jgi:ABC-type phosphate transport system permease subunit
VIRFVIELLAAIPSVVYGLWGIFDQRIHRISAIPPLLSACNAESLHRPY